MADYDERIVALYDLDNPDGPDHDFYRSLAALSQVKAILDVGCGTGILTVTLAAGGRRVVGVDPSPAMLAFARRRPGADGVEWIDGDSQAAPRVPFDLAVMTGNVAQHIPEAHWERTLRDLRARMADGGMLSFESRNPQARAWEGWGSGERSTRETPRGPLAEWTEVERVDEGLGDGSTVRLREHNRFGRQGDTVITEQTLHFRSRAKIEADLRVAGFEVEAVYGDWAGTALDAPREKPATLMVFVARAR
ncbi:class I SAM-dependent methyltransferase [Galactobacter caseinivorans]|uniref:Class I SAM-dependent methyltransferase n=1 Tax=Galactobacter caseinivorans TaxID=2676123 RepID=A0A496PKZ1_9MICC|nr:class I SAM-dependent methyltransferase [Galactobacter caseinivorans]RKW71100.1 class I SAM-dependent methyltransferase [Galactobacter caseinivorans]